MKLASKDRLQLVGAKQWTRSELMNSQANWEFMWVKDWPLHHLPTAWCWEMDRELNSEKPPFIAAWKKRHGEAKPVENCELAGRFIPFHEVFQLYAFSNECNYYNGSFPRTVHAVEINLRRPTKEILNDLKGEINSIKVGASLWRNSKPRAGERKKRGRKDYLAWFRDLAISRLSTAGVRSKEQMNLLPDQMTGMLSRDFANWNYKKVATKQRIAERLHGLRKYARIVSEDGNLKESPNWFDHFIQL